MSDPQPDAHADGRPRFTSETAREAGRRSGEARRRKKAEREAIAELTKAARARALESVHGDGGALGIPPDGAGSNAADLRSSALAVVDLLLDMALTGKVPVRHAGDLAALVDKVHAIYRLEGGESTSNTAHLTVSSDAVLAKLEAVRRDFDPPPGGDAA